MPECRICLAVRKNTQCVFEPTCRSSITYADMITFVASVKMIRDDGITDQVCLACRRKLKDLYEFKLLIQKSNTSLHQKVNSHMKTIHFNDITEIKLEIDMTPVDNKYLVKELEDVKVSLFNTKDPVCYNNTTIKKLETNTVDAELEKEPMSVIDFLNTIKEDPDDNCHNSFIVNGFGNYPQGENSDADEYIPHEDDTDGDEYVPPYSKKKYSKKTNKKKNHKLSKKDEGRTSGAAFKKVLIKPIIINDLRLMSTYEPRKPREKKKVIYKSRQKESICPYCGKLTMSLNSHMLVHSEPKFKCDKCPKGYHSRKALEDHKNKHSNVKQFKCDQCLAAFYTRDSLRGHVASHQDIRKYVCDICNKSYKRRHQLARHVRTHNSANKCHKCEQCSMSFFCAVGLRHHMRVHTGERPFNCELCSQPYSYKHDFNRHCLKKHGIFLKRRAVYVMNEEVLARERGVMRELMSRARGLVAGEPLIPFDGPNAAQAFEYAINAFRKNPLLLNMS